MLVAVIMALSALSQLSTITGVLSAVLYYNYTNPSLMTTQIRPTPRKPWADGPLKMIKTPFYETKEDDTWTKGASHMALLHNAVLRGYNTIYLQTPHVQPPYYPSFIGYCLAWHHLVTSHHDDEEANLFPKIAEVLDKDEKEIWGETHAEHEAMLPPLAKFYNYLTGLKTPEDFSSEKLLHILGEVQGPLDTHFHNEIPLIASLSRFGSHPEAAPVFAAWGKKTLTKAGYAEVVPFVFLNFDRTYEDGLWADWPPMPKVIRYLMVRISAWWKGGLWKFASCDIDGYPKDLYALGEGKENATL